MNLTFKENLLGIPMDGFLSGHSIRASTWTAYIVFIILDSVTLFDATD